MIFSRVTIWRYGLKLLNSLDWKCAKCGSTEDLTIHHKDRNGINKHKKGERMNNDKSNLEVICRSCHGKIHSEEAKIVRKKKEYRQVWNYDTRKYDVIVI